MLQYLRFIVIVGFTFLVTTPVVAQEKEKKRLEAKRRKLKKEITKIKNYLDKTAKKEKSISNEVKDLAQKIDTRENLITTISDEIVLMDSEIKVNTQKIKVLKEELTLLKTEYADLIYQSYKNKTEESKLMFILSSDNFYQSYQRFQYMKQYTQYRKDQGDSIKSKAMKLRVMNDSIGIMKTQKQTLIDEKKYEQEQIAIEKSKQEDLVKKYRKQKRKYKAQIRRKQREERALKKQIEVAIRKAIKKANTGKGTKKTKFALSPAAKALAGEFESNKGKLPWPVSNGLVTVRFGTHPDPMDKSLKISSSGVRIATSDGSEARSVFQGTVMEIQKNPQNGVLTILIQHGNYITVYSNLESVFVAKGDKVKTKEKIGVIHTHKITGKTILKFQIWKNVITQDPSKWVFKL